MNQLIVLHIYGSLPLSITKVAIHPPPPPGGNFSEILELNDKQFDLEISSRAPSPRKSHGCRIQFAFFVIVSPLY